MQQRTNANAPPHEQRPEWWFDAAAMALARARARRRIIPRSGAEGTGFARGSIVAGVRAAGTQPPPQTPGGPTQHGFSPGGGWGIT